MTIATRFLAAAREGRIISGAQKRWKDAGHILRENFYRLMLGLLYPDVRSMPAISLRGDFSSLPLSVLVKKALSQTIANIGGPSDFVRAIDGMSGQKYRTFINNLVKDHPDPRYLEIGSWAGSTATAALSGNVVTALCIDNWSQFGGPKAAFFTNIDLVRSPKVNFRFIESDFRRVDYTTLGRFNIYLFDGPHEEQDQYDGIMIARPALERPFVLIVDDWNWRFARIGTFRAIRDAGYSICSSVEIRTTDDNSQPIRSGKDSDWHNGYFIAVLK